jgi:hypothetical protein
MAELHHKLGDDFSLASSRSEDLLTSSFFGLMRYLPWQVLADCMKEVLWFEPGSETGRPQPGWFPTPRDRAPTYTFWGCLKEPGPPNRQGIPDLRIDSSRMRVGIEVKYDEGKHNLNADDDQLVRYWHLLRTDWDGDSRIVYLTRHRRPPLSDIKESLEFASSRPGHDGFRLGWVSWTTLFEVLAGWNRCGKLSESARLITRDLLDLLIHRNLHPFQGFPCEPLPWQALPEEWFPGPAPAPRHPWPTPPPPIPAVRPWHFRRNPWIQ